MYFYSGALIYFHSGADRQSLAFGPVHLVDCPEMNDLPNQPLSRA